MLNMPPRSKRKALHEANGNADGRANEDVKALRDMIHSIDVQGMQ
jgi:hypothetical protein